MQEGTNVAKGVGAGASAMRESPPEAPGRGRRSDRDSEPLVVELAWLVVEGAVVLRRVRAILARI